MNTETFERLLKQAVPDGKTIREIRIRTEKPVSVKSAAFLLLEYFSDKPPLQSGQTQSYIRHLRESDDRAIYIYNPDSKPS